MLIFFSLSERGSKSNASKSVRRIPTIIEFVIYKNVDVVIKFFSVDKPKRFWPLLKNFDDGEKKLFKLWFHSNLGLTWDNFSWTGDFKLNDKWKNYRLVATWRCSVIQCMVGVFIHFYEVYKFSNLVRFKLVQLKNYFQIRDMEYGFHQEKRGKIVNHLRCLIYWKFLHSFLDTLNVICCWSGHRNITAKTRPIPFW